jgi:hypothetical protein
MSWWVLVVSVCVYTAGCERDQGVSTEEANVASAQGSEAVIEEVSVESDDPVGQLVAQLADVLTVRGNELAALLENPNGFSKANAMVIVQTYYDETKYCIQLGALVNENVPGMSRLCAGYASQLGALNSCWLELNGEVRDSQMFDSAFTAHIFGEDYSPRARQMETPLALYLLSRGKGTYWEAYPDARSNEFDSVISIWELCARMDAINQSFQNR